VIVKKGLNIINEQVSIPTLMMIKFRATLPLKSAQMCHSAGVPGDVVLAHVHGLPHRSQHSLQEGIHHRLARVKSQMCVQ